jgi:ATP-dependent RNA helicase DeaD
MTDNEQTQGNAAADFTMLGVDASYIDILKNKGIFSPSIIQQLALPPITEGRDVIVYSGTGTGKTLAYVLPLLPRIDWTSLVLQMLIIVPTQELAMQIVREIDSLVGAGKVAPLIGGASMQRQIDRLKKHPVIAVGTPGRLSELLKMRKLKLQGVHRVVVDEVDQVFALGAGAAAEVEGILKAIPEERQLIFVTATVTESVDRSSRIWMKDSITVRGQTQAEASAAVVHQYIVCERREKIDLVRRLVRTVQPVAALIFVKETEIIGELESKLKFAGLQVESLYGDAGKLERAAVMKRFAAGKLKLLIASDVAARGIDVTRISHIINFEPPADQEQYIHRSGRTGRMGRSGTVVTLTTPGERAPMQKLAAKLAIELIEMKLSHGEWKDATLRSSSQRDSAAIAPANQTRSVPATKLKNPSKKTPSGKAVSPSIPNQSADFSEKSKPSTLRKDKDRNRKRDSKNKGAPRWLKDKQSSKTNPDKADS